jgi:hypothetical protein
MADLFVSNGRLSIQRLKTAPRVKPPTNNARRLTRVSLQPIMIIVLEMEFNLPGGFADR